MQHLEASETQVRYRHGYQLWFFSSRHEIRKNPTKVPALFPLRSIEDVVSIAHYETVMAEQNISRQDGTERRASGRFRIEQEIRYRLLDRKNGNRSGSGRTLDMSSGGVFFTANEPLPEGKRVELAVDWPARLDGRCALKFVVTGRVVRTQAGAAAVAIERYEFRTRGSSLLPEIGRE
jgi:hypothetical protein